MSTQRIHFAATYGDVSGLRRSVVTGNKVEAKDLCGQTPLILASTNGRLEAVKYLVEEAGANVEAKEHDGNTPLILASRRGHFEVLKYLVEQAGATVDAKNNIGKSALDLARQFKKTALVQYLEQGPQQQQAGLHAPSSPSEPPQINTNRGEFASTLEQWARTVESLMSGYIVRFDEWKEQQNQKCQAQLEALDEEIAKIERKKAAIQQENTDTVSLASEAAEVSVRDFERIISNARKIVGNIGADGQSGASAPSAHSHDENPPVSLCCPITLQLMSDPVIIIEDGLTYERSAILEHWRTQESQGRPVSSPQTNQRISSKQLAPNVLVRSQCREWQQQHPNWSS